MVSRGYNLAGTAVVVFSASLSQAAPLVEGLTIARSVGLNPEVLVASGYSAEDLSAIDARILAATEKVEGLRVAEAALADAVQSEASALGAALACENQEACRLAINEARSAKAAALVALADARAQLRAIALGAEDPRLVVAERIVAAPSSVPIAIRACTVPVVWTQVQSALREDARSLRMEGMTISSTARLLLESIRFDPAVISAQQHLDTNLAPMITAWAQP